MPVKNAITLKDRKNRKLSIPQRHLILGLMPSAKERADLEVKIGEYKKSDWNWRFNHHMDQLAISLGLRQGHLKGSYKNDKL